MSRRRFLVPVLVLAALAVGAAGYAVGWLRPAGMYRPQDRPVPAFVAAGPLRLTAFGTSLTANASWPDALAERLGDCLGVPVTTRVVAQPGAASDWGLDAVGDVAATEPDLILLEFAINDADLRDGLSLAESRRTHAAILDRLADAAPDARVVLLTMNPAFGPRGLLRPRLAEYYRAYGPLAEAAGAGLVDLYPLWLGLDGLRGAIPDGLHPADDAARRVIVEPLAQAIAAGAGATCPPVSPPPGGSG